MWSIVAGKNKSFIHSVGLDVGQLDLIHFLDMFSSELIFKYWLTRILLTGNQGNFYRLHFSSLMPDGWVSL